jgi:hypothetical protein
MSSSDEKVNKIEQILNDVSERVEKLEQGINEFKSGFTESGSDEEETVTTPSPLEPIDSSNDSRNSEYNGSKPMVQTQLDSIRPNRKPNGQQVSSIQGKIRIRLDYLKNAGIPETDDEVIMLNDVLKGKFRGGRRTRRMRRGRSTKRRVTIHNKTRSHKKVRSHKKRH